MEYLNGAARVVVKIGSSLLVDDKTGSIRSDWLQSLSEDIRDMQSKGLEVVIVSSGSIALGRKVLRWSEKSLSLEQSQASAAVGQIQLAQAYQEALAQYGIRTAQILVTLEDSKDRRRYLNSQATVETLLEMGVVPIVNENDTVATDEIKYGDNDRLAAQVSVTIGADLLILLSDVDGFYSSNPMTDANANHYTTIEKITVPTKTLMIVETGLIFFLNGFPFLTGSSEYHSTKMLFSKTKIKELAGKVVPINFPFFSG